MREKRLFFFENVSTVLWIAMDSCWMLGINALALPLSILTVLTCLMVMPFDEKRISIQLVDAAVAAWACMNASWMLSDIKVWASGQFAARVCLGVILALLVGALAFAHGDTQLMQALLRRFRRLRFWRRP